MYLFCIEQVSKDIFHHNSHRILLLCAQMVLNGQNHLKNTIDKMLDTGGWTEPDREKHGTHTA